MAAFFFLVARRQTISEQPYSSSATQKRDDPSAWLGDASLVAREQVQATKITGIREDATQTRHPSDLGEGSATIAETCIRSIGYTTDVQTMSKATTRPLGQGQGRAWDAAAAPAPAPATTTTNVRQPNINAGNAVTVEKNQRLSRDAM